MQAAVLDIISSFTTLIAPARILVHPPPTATSLNPSCTNQASTNNPKLSATPNSVHDSSLGALIWDPPQPLSNDRTPTSYGSSAQPQKSSPLPPKMTSRLVLVIGDLHIPDRALDIPAKVNTHLSPLSSPQLSKHHLTPLTVQKTAHAWQNWPNSLSRQPNRPHHLQPSPLHLSRPTHRPRPLRHRLIPTPLLSRHSRIPTHRFP